MLSGRRSYLDLASRAAGAFTDDDVQVPFYFGDVVGRYERQLGPQHRLESSMLLTRDRVTDDVPDILQGFRVDHGNLIAQVSVASTTDQLRLTHRLGTSRFGSVADTTQADSALVERYNGGRTPRGRGRLSLIQLTGEVAPLAPGRPAWRAGYALEHERARSHGELNAVLGDELDVTWIRSTSSSTRAGAWYERAWRSARWDFQAGGRATLWSGACSPRHDWRFPLRHVRGCERLPALHADTSSPSRWTHGRDSAGRRTGSPRRTRSRRRRPTWQASGSNGGEAAGRLQ
jgi:hypothetical protein